MNIEKKVLIYFVGIIVIALGVTDTFQNNFISTLILFLGAYIAIKGL